LAQLGGAVALALAAAAAVFLSALLLQLVVTRRRVAAHAHAAGAVTALAALAFYGYAALRYAIRWTAGVTTPDAVLLPLVAVAFLGLATWLLWNPARAMRLTRPLNVFALLLLAMTTVRAAPSLLERVRGVAEARLVGADVWNVDAPPPD